MGNRAPIVSNVSRRVVSDESVRMKKVADIFDPDGDPIVRYKVRALGNGKGGFLKLKNRRLKTGRTYTLTAAQWALLTFNATFTNGRNDDTRIRVRAYDGKDWGVNGLVDFNTLQNANRPIIRVARAYRRNLKQIYSGTIVAASEFFSFYDQDRNSAKVYQFRDRTRGQGDLYFRGRKRNGRFRVKAEELALVQFRAGDSAGQSLIEIRGNDGRFWSSTARMRVETIGRPVFEPEADETFVLDEQEQVAATDLFFKTDPGPSVTKYQIYDANGERSSGTFYDGIDALAANEIHTLTSDEFANLIFEGGKFEGRSHDEVFIRGFNGTRWSKWTSFTVNTEPNMIDSLLAESWVNYETSRDPLILTYTFMNRLPAFYIGEDEANNFTGLTNPLRAAARQALDVYESVLNVRFVETTEENLGTIAFGMADGDDDALAWAKFPAPPETDIPGAAGDVWYNWWDFPFFWLSGSSKGPGSSAFFVTLHELGHAMGLKHPFDPSGPILPRSMDNNQNTVMSYSPDPFNDNLYSETLGLYDIASLQESYGANTTYMNDDSRWYLEKDVGKRMTIWDTGGFDTLSAKNQNIGATIDLREGRFSSIGRHRDFFGTLKPTA